uniref:Uncharacterized protein n=1 Tax=Kalanchoe fedtschenkoi TaxID=63787 RepID=A0A7N0SV73_KALFE
MATNCTHRNSISNNIASILLNDHHHRSRHAHHRIWTAAFRRRIVDLIACGGASHSRRCGSREDADEDEEGDGRSDGSSKRPGSGKLSDLLLNSSEEEEELELGDCAEAEKRRKVEALEEMKGAVRRLADGREEEAVRAAGEVRRLAKDDPFARETLAMLGAIPPLVEMLECGGGDEWKVASLYALLNLAIGNDLNKAAIVKAGAVHKMLHMIGLAAGSLSAAVEEAIVANFLGLSALDSNKLVIGSSGAVPFLVKIVKDVAYRGNSQIKQDALRALYNLSILHLNIPFILETDLITYFVNALGDMDVSERILSILSNVVSTPEGRKAISAVPDAYPILVDVLNWNDSPGCQEKVLYVLMVIAHKVYGGRQAMVEAGAMSALLELTLVGSTLAQKRASRILDSLSLDKGKRLSDRYNGGLTTTLSAPIHGSSSTFSGSSWDHKESLEGDQDMMSEEKKAVNQLVQQSLQNNMTRIAQRANLPQDFVPSVHFKTLTQSSTSKSLPF